MNITINIPIRRVFDVVVNAIANNACGYWSNLNEFFDYSLPTNFDLKNLDWLEGDWSKVSQIYFAPFIEGGEIRFRVDDTNEEKVLNLKTIHRGIELMAEKEPKHFGDLLSGNDDVETADVLIQLCVLGEVIYG